MKTERTIGIDFGTSTSVMRVKRYQGGKPMNDRLETKAVTFNMGNTMVPTLIQEVNGERYYGFDAANRKRKEIVYSNFKLDLESEDVDVRAKARSLTEDFLKYLAKTYREQSEAGHLGEVQDRERTIISYPVKWSDDTKRFMIQAAKSAGFPNVEGMDEATAAIQAIAVQNSEMLRQKGYFKDGQPINLLLIDMGAGTTDLVLCRHTPGEGAPEILCTYPQKGKTLFGGQELDAFLMDYIREKLPEGSADTVLRNCGVAQFKAWKEGTVSPSLMKGEAVTYCGPVDQLLNIMGMDMEPYHLDRSEFERCAADHLKQLPELVNGCLSKAGMDGGDVDLVVLTGGHSQWYFTTEMLKGAMKSLGDMNLKKIERNPDRIIQIALPQETVALGLVYSPMNTSQATEQNYAQKAQSEQSSGSATIVKAVAHRNISEESVAFSESNSFPLKYNPRSMIRPVMTCRSGEDKPFFINSKGELIELDRRFGEDVPVIRERNVSAVSFARDSTGCRSIILYRDGSTSKGDCTGCRSGILYRDGSTSRGSGNILAVASVSSNEHYGLTQQGKVVAISRGYGDPRREAREAIISKWTGIKAISGTHDTLYGLHENGTVLSSNESSYDYKKICQWKEVVAIATSRYYIAALKKDGTVCACGSYSVGGTGFWGISPKSCVNQLSDIIAISCGAAHTVGLKKDGTVVAVGGNKYGQCNVITWRDIIAIAAGEASTWGLKADGSVIVACENLGFFSTCPRDVSSIKLF